MSDLKGTCTECKRTMRNSRISKAKYPDTVPYHAHNMCSGCYRRKNNAYSRTPKVVDVAAVERTLNHYLEWRRSFRAKLVKS